MPAHTHDDDVFREKRKIKNPITFKIPLNEEQKIAKEHILNNTLTVLAGKAGSGKTLLACQVALDGLLRRHYEKIIITRPTVSKESIGYLPGDLHQKMDPWLQPIYHNLFALYGKDKVQPLIDQDKIEIVPVAFMRGRTFLDSCIIVDEAQNVTFEQMEMIVTRIGIRSRMIICGDDAQVDLRYKSESGFKFLYNTADRINDAIAIKLTENHRHTIVDDLIEAYADHNKKENEK
jgi:phosphate starvation-inducible protein PhoH and related proteins